MSDQELLTKIQNGERLTERELKYLVYDGAEVDEVEGEEHRWTRSITTVVNLCGVYVAIDWQRGLTENQENEFWNQPYFVHKEEKTVVVTNWVKSDREYELENTTSLDQEANSEKESCPPAMNSTTLKFVELLKKEMNQEQDWDQENER